MPFEILIRVRKIVLHGKNDTDLDRGIFGMAVDPNNPYRVLFFERWTATNTGPLKVGPLTIPATGKRVETPVHVTSLVWNPDGKIIYQAISPPVDRFEGSTKGTGAISVSSPARESTRARRPSARPG